MEETLSFGQIRVQFGMPETLANFVSLSFYKPTHRIAQRFKKLAGRIAKLLCRLVMRETAVDIQGGKGITGEQRLFSVPQRLTFQNRRCDLCHPKRNGADSFAGDDCTKHPDHLFDLIEVT